MISRYNYLLPPSERTYNWLDGERMPATYEFYINYTQFHPIQYSAKASKTGFFSKATGMKVSHKELTDEGMAKFYSRIHRQP